MHSEDEDGVPAWFTASRYAPRVGDRVRVRPSAECPIHAGWETSMPIPADHPLTGRIIDDLRKSSRPWYDFKSGIPQVGPMNHDHRWVVEFDRPLGLHPSYGQEVNGDVACAEELEYLGRDPDYDPLPYVAYIVEE